MGLASGKTKLKLIDIESGSDRGKARVGDIRPFAFQKPSSANLPLDCQDVDGATEIGSSLRDARERSGQNLRDISQHLKIRHEYLRAIEDGDFKSLPGMTYAIGYVRTYAQYLDLDVESAIALFKSEAQDIDGPRQLVFPSPAPEGKVPGGAVMFIAAFLAVFAYAGWYYVTDSGRSVAGYTLAIPESLQSWLDEKVDGTGSSDGFTSTAVASISTPAVAIASPNTSEPVNSVSEDATPTVSPTPPSEGVPRTDAVPSDTVTVSSTAATEATTTDAGLIATEISTPLETATAPTGEADPVISQITQITAATLPIVAPEPAPEALPAALPSAVASVEEAPKPIVATTTVALADIPKAALVNSPVGGLADWAASGARVQPATTTSPVSDQTRIVIQATAPSWVQVRAADSSTVMTRVMRAGDVYEVPDRDGLRLFTGNAGALTILVDGKEIPKLGGSGQIARNIDLEPANLRQRFN